MKKIGFIDHYLNNFHANEYYKLIKSLHDKDGFEVAYAFGEVEHDGVDNAAWAKEKNVDLIDY